MLGLQIQDKTSPALEVACGAIYLEMDEFTKPAGHRLPCVLDPRYTLELCQVLSGNIDPALGAIPTYILPEVSKLQAGADVIGSTKLSGGCLSKQ